MSNTSVDDPIFELRLYRIQPGRIADMERRMQDDLATLFPRHGIRPLGTWSVVAGPSEPLFVYLMGWSHMQQRTSCFAGFATDPQWAETRVRTNAGSELVERFEILFLRAVTPWQPPPAGDETEEPIVELLLQEVAQGHGPAVRKAMLEAAIPAWTEAGATVCGVFDVMSGYSLPSAVFVVAWKNLAERMKAHKALAVKMAGEQGAGGVSLLQRADHYLMRPVPVSWA